MEAAAAPTPPTPQEKVPTSGLAIASLICGLAGFLFSILTGIPAIIMGHMALSRIKASGGTLGGGGIALAGTILGYITSILIFFIAILAGLAAPVILKAKKNADKAKLINECTQISISLSEYHHEKGIYPSEEDFSTAVTLPVVKNHIKGDWLYYPKSSILENSPLLITPFIIKDEALVLWTDSSVTQHKEDEVLRIIEGSNSEPVHFKATLPSK